MIQVTSHMRIVVAVEAVDFRNGIDGLVQIPRETSLTMQPGDRPRKSRKVTAATGPRPSQEPGRFVSSTGR